MPAWVAPAAIALGGALLNAFTAHRGRKVNEGYIREQNEYNSPVSQMARYQAAGLNPRLIYTQGNPGNQSSVPEAPDISHAGSDLVSSYNASSVSQSQVSATSAKVAVDKQRVEVMKLQEKVLARNPLLADSAYSAIIQSLVDAAKIKAQQVGIAENEKFYSDSVKQHQVNKIFKEVELLEQKFELNKLDKSIKTEVLKSKEFQNAILEVQKKFMADGDIGPSQIYQFIHMLLMKSL